MSDDLNQSQRKVMDDMKMIIETIDLALIPLMKEHAMPGETVIAGVLRYALGGVQAGGPIHLHEMIKEPYTFAILLAFGYPPDVALSKLEDGMAELFEDENDDGSDTTMQ